MSKAFRSARTAHTNLKLQRKWEKKQPIPDRAPVKPKLPQRKRIGLSVAIQAAILAALGCTTIDYHSPKKLDEAAEQIARFVEDALIPRPL